MEAESAYARQAETVNKLESQISYTNGEISKLSKELETNSRNLEEARSNAIKYGESLQEVGTKITTIGESVSKAGATLTVGLTAPIVAAGTAAVAAFNEVDDGADIVIKKTGAVGDAAKDLQSTYEAVAGSIEASKFSFGDVGAAVGEINTRFGFTDKKLEETSKKFLRFAEANDTDVTTSVQLVSRAMENARIPLENYEEVLDALTVAGQVSGVAIDALASNVTKHGASFRALGYDTKESIAIMAKWEKEGVNIDTALTAMKKAVSNFASSGKDAKTEFANLIKGIQDGTINGEKALKIFGNKAGTDFIEVIQQGKLNFADMVDAIAGSEGALDNTFDGLIDGSDRAKQAMNNGKIALSKFGEAGMNLLTPVMEDVTDLLGKATNALSKMTDEEKKNIIKTAGIVAAAGPALKIVGTSINSVGKLTTGVGGLVKDLGKVSAARKSAKALGQIGSEAISSTDGVSGLSKILARLATPTGAAVVAAGVLIGVGAAIWKIRDDAIKADIAKHFGNIKLSAEEVEDVAQRLTKSEWKMKVSAAIDAKADLEQAESDLKSSLETIDKLNWMVSVGMELTEEEKSAYISSVEEFAKNASAYITQQGYTISLALQATIGTDSGTGAGLSSFVNTYMTSAQGELEDLGKQLAEKVNKSFENGTFAEDQIDIQKIYDQMNGIIQKISDAEYRAKLGHMELEYASEGIGIDKDSFDRLNKKISENTQELLDDSKDAKVTALTGVELQYEALIDAGVSKEFAEKIYNDAKGEIEQATISQQGEAINIGLNFAFDTVSKNYKEEIGKSKKEISQYTEEYLDGIKEDIKNGTILWATAITEFEQESPRLEGSAKETVKDMLKSLRPQKESLQAIADECIAAGRSVPDSVKQGLSDIAQWEAMAGSASGMYDLLAQELAENPAKFEVLRESAEFGKNIPEELAKAISVHTGYVYNATTGIWEQVTQGSELSAEEAANLLNEHGTTLGESLSESLKSQYGLIYQDGKYMVDQAAKGAEDSKSTFVKTSKDVAAAGVAGMKTEINGTTLNPPKMEEPDWTPQVKRALSTMQSVVSGSKLVVDVITNVSSNITPHADGGIVTSPEIGLIGEAGPEAIIPLSVSRRSEAISLLSTVEGIMGYDPFAYSAGAARSIAANHQRPIQAAAPEQKVYKFEAGAIQTEINTTSRDPDELYDEFSRRLNQDIGRIVRSSRGG